MTGIAFKVTLSGGLNAKLNQFNLKDSEVSILMEKLPQMCRETCTFSYPGAELPVLDLGAVESFLRVFETTVTSASTNIAPGSDLKISVLCFHMLESETPGAATIQFFLYDTHPKEEIPLSRVICAVSNNITYH